MTHDLDAGHLQFGEPVEGFIHHVLLVDGVPQAGQLLMLLEQGLNAVPGRLNSLKGLGHFGLGAFQLTGLLEDGLGGPEVHAVHAQLGDVEAGTVVGLDVGGISHGGEGDDRRAVLDFDGNDGQLAHGVWGLGLMGSGPSAPLGFDIRRTL